MGKEDAIAKKWARWIEAYPDGCSDTPELALRAAIKETLRIITTKPCGCLMRRDDKRVIAECEKHADPNTDTPINRERVCECPKSGHGHASWCPKI